MYGNDLVRKKQEGTRESKTSSRRRPGEQRLGRVHIKPKQQAGSPGVYRGLRRTSRLRRGSLSSLRPIGLERKRRMRRATTESKSRFGELCLYIVDLCGSCV